MGMWAKLIRGDDTRRTRFHDSLGNLVPLRRWPNFIRACWSWLLTKAGVRPRIPWLGYSAIRRLRGLIRKDWTVVEFGAGGSTDWFARRCGRLISIEHDPAWFRPRPDVDCRLRGAENYASLDDINHVDLVLVDGSLQRLACVKAALPKARFIFLDNADTPSPEFAEAVRLLEHHAIWTRWYVDFYPATPHATAGLLARIR